MIKMFKKILCCVAACGCLLCGGCSLTTDTYGTEHGLSLLRMTTEAGESVLMLNQCLSFGLMSDQVEFFEKWLAR